MIMEHMSLINNLNIENLKKEAESSHPFPFFYVDDFLDKEFANAIYDSFPGFEQASKIGRSFNAVNEAKKVQITDSSKFPKPIFHLNKLLSSQEFLSAISEIMNISNLVADPQLVGGGIHETDGGGRLDVHVDFNFNKELKLFRRVNILIYFNKEWEEGYGGILDLWDSDVKKCHARIAPVFNRMACFATSEISYHGVTPLKCPPGITRKSFAAYYYNDGKDGANIVKPHSTIFKARPNEMFKGYIRMPLEKSKFFLAQGAGAIKNIVKKLIK